MIKKNIKASDLRGRSAIVDRDIQNGAGHGISKGSKVVIEDSIRGLGVTIVSPRCEHCGQYTSIRGVSRIDLTLVDDNE